MTAFITAGARTPWAPRHGLLEQVRSEDLLTAALSGALDRARLSPEDVRLLLVACDTGVGAQDLNLGRRAAVALGWFDIPAVTVDGQGVADLGLVGLAASHVIASGGGGRSAVLVAAVDSTTTVPPGAGLVRDYGRPAIEEPRQLTLERLALEAGLTSRDLDAEVRRVLQRHSAPPPHRGIVATGPRGVRADGGADIVLDADDLLPLNGDGGLLTAFHEAPLADGAAAVAVESGQTDGRSVTACLRAKGGEGLASNLQALAACEEPFVLADSNVVTHCLLGGGHDEQLAPVRAVGNTPSANGLRMVVDALYLTKAATAIVSLGAQGQLARATLGPAEGVP